MRTQFDHGQGYSVKLFELGLRTPGGLFLGVRYAGDVDIRRFRTPSLPIFGVILGLLEMTKMYRHTLYMFEIVRSYTLCWKARGRLPISHD